MTTALFSFVAGILIRHYGPSLWARAKVWVGRKLFPNINS